MTVNATHYSEQASVYPGEYEPVPWKEKELQEEINRNGAKIMKPPVNITELEDHYQFEMAVPGFKAEDFFIYANGRLLTIAALNKKPVTPNEKLYYNHNFICECVHRRVRLPLTTDTNFATAEYRNGILTINFFKTRLPAINQPGRIVVY